MTLKTIRAVAFTGLVAGTCDITAAIIINCVLAGKMKITTLLQAIASGVFGKKAFEGGIEMALYGLTFHYLIALIFTILYFLLFPYVTVLRRYRLFSGLLYGFFAWLVMNLLVLPLSNVAPQRLHLGSSITGIAVLMVMLGLPIAFMTAAWYSKRTRVSVVL